MANGIQLVATDLDGTLLRSDGTVGERTRAALARAEDRGLTVVFVTARPARWIDSFRRLVGGHGIVICANGAIVRDVARGEDLEVSPLPQGVASDVAAAIRTAAPGVHFARESTTGFAREPGYRARDPIPPESPIGPIEALLDPTTVKLLVRHDAIPAVELRRRVDDAVGGRMTTTASDTSGLIEISAATVTKASTLRRFCSKRGVRAEEVVAVGDMLNDLPMLAWAGTAAAVANAHPEVLAVADEILPSNDEEGVAALLERLR